MSVEIVKHETEKSLFDRLYANLSDNPYFSAGAGLVGIGIAASIGKRAVILSNTLFRRKFVISLSLNNDDA
jgi:chaperone BCS1